MRLDHHPNIVQYREAFEQAGNLYIVMKYCDSGDLERFIQNRHGYHIPENQVLNILFKSVLDWGRYMTGRSSTGVILVFLTSLCVFSLSRFSLMTCPLELFYFAFLFLSPALVSCLPCCCCRMIHASVFSGTSRVRTFFFIIRRSCILETLALRAALIAPCRKQW